MAEKREEWRVSDTYPTRILEPAARGGFDLIASTAAGDTPCENENRARQIVREHNLHPKMLDALKDALSFYGDFDSDFDDGVPKTLRGIIAEAEKETP